MMGWKDAALFMRFMFI